MTAQEYILSELEKLKAPVKLQDIGGTSLEEAILARVHSKKFRKLKVDKAAVDIAKKSISMSLNSGEPVKLRLDFGGNKLWRFDEAPHIDWGELFSLMFYIDWAKYIAEVYEPGVLVSYFSMDVCVERLNNVPHEQTDKYTEDMRALFEWIKQFTPKGIQLEYVRYGDLYENRDEYYAELEASKAEILRANSGELSELNEKQKIATELNVKLKPGQDQDPQWREQVELEHDSIFSTKTGGAYLSDPKWIQHCPTWYSGYIATGSTKRSLAKFWVGVGALESKPDGSFNEIILTPKQLEKVKFDWQPVNIEGLKGKNLEQIRVL